ncbi:MAG: hybrid sensor histidine kinase/response regulator [Acidobacteriota bacterium]
MISDNGNDLAPLEKPTTSPNGEAKQTSALIDDDMQAELLAAFKSELDEYLETLNRDLIKLEQNGMDEAVLQEIFRTAHNMKGTAGVFGLTGIQKIAHSLENLFGAVRRNEYRFDRPAFDLCYEGLDAINRLMEMGLTSTTLPPLEIEFGEKMEQILKGGTAVEATSAQTIIPVSNESVPLEESQAPTIEQNAPTQQDVQTPLETPISSSNETVKPVNNSALQTSNTGMVKASKNPNTVPAIFTGNTEQHSTSGETSLLRANDSSEMKAVGNKTLETAVAVKSEFIRIPLNKIDHLMSNVGELIIARSRSEQRFNEIQQINIELAQVLKELQRLRPLRRKLTKSTNGKNAALPSQHNHPDKGLDNFLGTVDLCQNRLKNINNLLQIHTENSANDDLHLELIISSIQGEVQGLRMLPIDTLFEPLRRRARDIARKQEKDVSINFDGGETELDRQLIEAMRDPLVHLITNSIDHGLESTQQRKLMGKPTTGNLSLVAGQRGNQIIIEISDDGGGINITKVKEKAISAGLFNERELEVLSEPELLSIIFRPGFSTKSTVTELSGRGVGLDVVKVSVEKLQGQIEISTKLGVGTTFRITIPLTLSTQRVLLVKSAEQIFALPVNSIERVMNIPTGEIYSIETHLAFSLDGRAISLVSLDSILGISNQNKEAADQTIALILAQGVDRVAFIIDEVLGEQEMVVKPLGKPLRKMPNISGGAILGDGNVVLLLNPADLLRTVRGTPRMAAKLSQRTEQQIDKHKILVVDDSITTRTLEKNILEMAGYEVFLAHDGAEGLALARTVGCHLIISDVEMPHLNGFELTRQIKSDPQLKQLPVVLVSSLDSQKDKAQSAEAGADAYIVKGLFDQKSFLEVVQNMLTS